MSDILFIPDIHCKPEMIDLADKVSKYDDISIKHIIFMGDYVDDWDKTYHENLMILNKIIKYKKDNYDKVTLLLGNHELSYLGFPCSGHQKSYETEMILRENIHLFDLAVARGGALISHAGFTSNWLHEIEGHYRKTMSTYLIEDLNNGLHNFDRELLEYLSAASYTSGGAGDCASILWSRPRDHITYPINYKQVVGHTPIRDYIVDGKKNTVGINNLSDNMYYIDTFSTYSNGEPIGNQDLLILAEEQGIFFYRNKYNDYKEIEYNG